MYRYFYVTSLDFTVLSTLSRRTLLVIISELCTCPRCSRVGSAITLSVIWVLKSLSYLESWSGIRLELRSKSSTAKRQSGSSSTVLPSLLFVSLVWITLCFGTSIYTPHTSVSSRYSWGGRGNPWHVFWREGKRLRFGTFFSSRDLPFSAPLGMTLKNKILT